MAESVGTLVADLQLAGLSRFQVGLKKAGAGFDKLGTAAKIAGGLIVGAIAVKAVQAFASGLASAVEFQKAMAEVATLTNATAKETKVLSDNVSRLSAEFGSPAVETAAALYQTISAGFSDAADSSKILEASLKLAIGGVTNTTTAVDGLTTILSSYQLDASAATSVSDKLFVAMRAGKTTIGELSKSMGAVSSIAAALGVDLDSTLAAVSALTTGGKKTSVAVTELRAVFVNILKPSAQAAKLAKSLGIEFNAAALKSKGLAKFLEDVKQKTGGSTEALSLLFGSVEAVGAVLGLTGPQMEAFNKIQEEMKTAAGATSDAVQIMKDTADFKLDKLNEAWSEFKRTLADNVVPAVTATVTVFNDIVSATGRTIKSLQGLSTVEKVYEKMAEDANKASAETKSLADRTKTAQKELKNLGLTGQEIEKIFLNQSKRVDLVVGGLEGLESAANILGGQIGKTAERVLEFDDSLLTVGADAGKVSDAIADVLGETGGGKAAKGAEELRKEMERLEAATRRAEEAAEDFLLAFEKTAGRETARALTGLEPAREIQVAPQTVTLAPAGFEALESEIDQRVIDIGGTLTPDFKALDAEITKSAQGASSLEKAVALFGAQASGASAALATGDIVGAAIALIASTGALDEVMASVSNLVTKLVAPFEDIFTALSVLVEIAAVLVEDALKPLIPAIQPLARLMVVLGELTAALLEPMLELSGGFGAIENVMIALGAAINVVSTVIRGITRAIVSAFIGILKLVDKIPFVDLEKQIKKLEKARDQIGQRESAIDRERREAAERGAEAAEDARKNARIAAQAGTALKDLGDETRKINEQFKQLPSGFKLQKTIFESLEGIPRDGLPGAPGFIPASQGRSLFDIEDEARERNLSAAGLLPGVTGGGGGGIVIQNQTVVTPDASGFADELAGQTARANVLQTGSESPAGESAFSGSP